MPEWIHQSVEEEKKEDPLLYTGKRVRKEVNYRDMSDSQANKMFETGVDPKEESNNAWTLVYSVGELTQHGMNIAYYYD